MTISLIERFVWSLVWYCAKQSQNPLHSLIVRFFRGQNGQHDSYFWRRILNILYIQRDFSPCSTGVISLTSLGPTWTSESRYWEEKKASVDKGIPGVFHSLQSLKHMFCKWILSFKHGFYTDQHSLTTPPNLSMNFPWGELCVFLTAAQRALPCYPCPGPLCAAKTKRPNLARVWLQALSARAELSARALLTNN